MRRLDKKTKTTTYVCDRCRKAFAESKPLETPGDNRVSRGVSIPLPVIDGDKIAFREKDLCGSCVRSLDAWAKKRS